MATQEQLINKVKNVSVYTREEREEWVKKIKSGDKKAIASAQKLMKGASPSEKEIGISYKKEGNKIIKVSKKSAPQKAKPNPPVEKPQLPTQKKYIPSVERKSTPPIHETVKITAPQLKQYYQGYVDPYEQAGMDLIGVTLAYDEPLVNAQAKQVEAQEKQLLAEEQKLKSLKGKISDEQYSTLSLKLKQQEEIIKQNKKIVEENKKLISQNKQRASALKDLGKHRKEYYAHEYGSSNDLKDMAIAGGSGALIGGAIAGIVAGPEAIPLGMAIGGISSEVGQATGEIVAYKTGNQELATIVDIGASTITAVGISEGANILARKTAKTAIENEVKAYTKIGSPTESYASVESTIEYKSLGGLVKKTKQTKQIIKLNVIKEDYAIVKEGENIAVLSKGDAYKAGSHVLTETGELKSVASYDVYNKIVGVKDYSTAAIYKQGQEEGKLYVIKSILRGRQAEGSDIVKMKGDLGSKYVLFDTENKNIKLAIGKSAFKSEDSKLIVKNKIKQIVFYPAEENKITESSKVLNLEEISKDIKNIGAVNTLLSSQANELSKAQASVFLKEQTAGITDITKKMKIIGVMREIKKQKKEEKSKIITKMDEIKNIKEFESVKITTIGKSKNISKIKEVSKVKTQQKANQTSRTKTTNRISSSMKEIENIKNELKINEKVSVKVKVSLKQDVKNKQIQKQKIKQLYKYSLTPFNVNEEISTSGTSAFSFPSLNTSVNKRYVLKEVKKKRSRSEEFKPKFSWADLNILGKPKQPKPTKKNKKKDLMFLKKKGGISHMYILKKRWKL